MQTLRARLEEAIGTLKGRDFHLAGPAQVASAQRVLVWDPKDDRETLVHQAAGRHGERTSAIRAAWIPAARRKAPRRV